jgi:hypothetical protein
MIETGPCPGVEELQRFLLGQTAEAEAQRLEQHLSDCPACLAAVQTLHATDTLVETVRAEAGKGVTPDPEVDEALITRLCRLPGLAAAAVNTIGGAGTSHDLTPPPADRTEELCPFLAPPQGPDEVGRLGPYRVLKRLGSGGMGLVFLAEDVRLRRLVALKVLRPVLAAHPAARERFLREAQAAAAVKNDHVVVIYQVGEEGGVPHMAMELLEGESLDDRLTREGRLPAAEVVRIGREVAEGLAAAHERGVIHRDVKPGNIWLEAGPGGRRRVKVLDFGLARAAAGGGQLTKEGAIVGTPGYMSPEQARGEAVDCRCDLFSLGSVLYRMATGAAPFKGADAMSTLLAVVTDRPRPPRELSPALPPALNDLIVRLMAKDRAERPASAREAVEALAAIERDLAAPPRPAPVRRRWRLAAAAVLLLALLGTAAWFYGPALVRIATNRGELLVQVDDPDIEVVVRQNGAVVVDRKKDRRYELTAMDGDIEFYEAASGVRLLVKHFRMERGGRVVVDARVELAEARKRPQPPEPPPPQPAAPGAREKPFVLVRKGAEVGGFKTFAGLWAEQQPGDEVVVYGDGPFPLPQVSIKDRALVLKAAPGFRPVFLPHESLFELRLRSWIQLDNGSLTVEGCDFLMRGMPVQPLWLLDGGGRACVLRNCRLVGLGSLFGDSRFSAITLEDCLLLTDGLGGLGWLGAGCELTLTNNLICCHMLLERLRAPGGQKLRLSRNAIACTWDGGLFGPIHEVEREAQLTGVTVVAENNLFYLNGWPIHEWFKERVRWQGKDNWYAGLEKGLKGWNARLAEPEVNSHEVPALEFDWRAGAAVTAERAIPWWQARLAEARKRSGLDDLGPDLSLVGPGEAYLRGLAAEGRPVPRERLRPEALAGGPIALIRGGKDLRGYFKLQDAFNAAQDGDVIEVRTDAAVEGCSVPQDRGELTLRAGPGYRPVIQARLFVQAGTALAVEGLTFSEPGDLLTDNRQDLPVEKRGRISRLAYCAFEGRADAVGVDCLFLGKGGSPAEISRCVTNRTGRLSFFLRVPKNTTVHIRECVLGFVGVYGPDNDKADCGTVDLEACIVAQTGIGLSVLGPGPGWGGPLSHPRWAVRRCLLESNGNLTHQLDGKPDWNGERNCYRIAREWPAQTGVYGLAQWRAYTGSRETGSVEDEPLIAEAQRWKLRPGSPAFGAGPDVDRVARRAPLPKAVEPPPPASPTPREKPFVLVRKGAEVGAFRTFAGLWAEQQPGDEVVVHGDGPFPLPQVQVKDRALVLKAAPGFRPVFLPHESLVQFRADCWIQLDNGSLTVEGCDFLMRGVPSELNTLRLLGGEGKTCVLRNCRLVGVVWVFRGCRLSAITLEDCLLSIYFLGDLGPGCELTLTNNLIYCHKLMDLLAPGGQKVRLSRNAIACWSAGGHPLLERLDTTGVTIVAEGNLFSLSDAMGPVVKEGVRWQGKDNWYAGLAKGLKGWNAQLAEPEVNSHEVPALELDWLVGAPVTAERALPWWQARLEQARKRSGLDDLGPNLALVGPGEAYLRGLAAEGRRPVPKERLRPEALPGGRIALIRGGKDFRGYLSLQEAFDAAQDGDVIEIRSDAALDGGEARPDRGELTLRAGAGYRPVIQTVIAVHPGTALALEGLTFSEQGRLVTFGGADLPVEKWGRISRLAYCAFDGREGPEIWAGQCLFRGKDGSPAEISRCITNKLFLLRIEKNITVHIRECVLGAVRVSGPDEKLDCGTVDLEACIAAQPGINPNVTIPLLSQAGPPGKDPRWVVRRCLLESNLSLSHTPKPNWNGERNCYRVAWEWSLGSSVFGLVQWRAYTGSREAGSVEDEPLMAEPQRWKLRPGSPASGAGPDVDRVARRPPPKAVEPPPPANPNPREKPFVLVRKGTEVGAFRTFAGLWEEHQPGDEVVVHGDGPFPLPQVSVKDRELVLKAAPGFRPVFLPHESLFELRGGAWIQLANGSLTVEGCDFLMRGMPPGVQPLSLFGGDGGRACVLHNCRLVGFISVFGSCRFSAITLEDCLLFTESTGSLGWLEAGCELTLTNNLISCGRLVERFQAPGGQKLRLSRNTIACSLLVERNNTDCITGVSVVAEGNLFYFPVPGGAWPLQEGLKERVRWQGKDNWYDGLKDGLKGWNAQLAEPEVNSHEAPALEFDWLVGVPATAERALPWWQTRLAEVRKRSGLDDLGPNLSLVGPGEAYVRGLAAEGRAVPKERLRSEALPGGRIVLIRGGKDFRGYFLLQDAFNAAQDGDVIEVRSDAAMQGGDVPQDRGSLTLRAGPGYRPVMQTPIGVHVGTALAVEGLTFSETSFLATEEEGKDLPVEKRGRISRLTYCAFEGAVDCLFWGKDGAPAEISRCITNKLFTLRIEKNTTVHIRECVLGAVVVSGPNKKGEDYGTVDLEACIAAQTGISVYLPLLGSITAPAHRPRWVVRRCLLESNSSLFHSEARPDWNGERNCYCLAREWPTSVAVCGLAQWRAYTENRETGSVEDEPLILEAQRWKLRPGSPAFGAGPDVDRVARRTPAQPR